MLGGARVKAKAQRHRKQRSSTPGPRIQAKGAKIRRPGRSLLPRPAKSGHSVLASEEQLVCDKYVLFPGGAKAGGFGRVFRAELAQSGDSPPSSFAVKEISEEKFEQQEAQLLRVKQHEHIIKFFEQFKQGRLHYIVCEWADGGTLLDHCCLSRLRDLEFEAMVSVHIGQVLLALRFLHTQEPKVAHGDIKGQNILLVRGVSKLGDFGISRVVHTVTATKDDTQVPDYNFAGTPGFMAPELLQQGVADLNPEIKLVPQPRHTDEQTEADIYALGCTVAQLLHKDKWNWLKLHPFLLIPRVMRGDSPDISDIQKWASEDCQDFLRQCFVRDPRQRPSAECLLEHPFITKHRPLSSTGDAEAKTKCSTLNSSVPVHAPEQDQGSTGAVASERGFTDSGDVHGHAAGHGGAVKSASAATVIQEPREPFEQEQSSTDAAAPQEFQQDSSARVEQRLTSVGAASKQGYWWTHLAGIIDKHLDNWAGDTQPTSELLASQVVSFGTPPRPEEVTELSKPVETTALPSLPPQGQEPKLSRADTELKQRNRVVATVHGESADIVGDDGAAYSSSALRASALHLQDTQAIAGEQDLSTSSRQGSSAEEPEAAPTLLRQLPEMQRQSTMERTPDRKQKLQPTRSNPTQASRKSSLAEAPQSFAPHQSNTNSPITQAMASCTPSESNVTRDGGPFALLALKAATQEHQTGTAAATAVRTATFDGRRVTPRGVAQQDSATAKPEQLTGAVTHDIVSAGGAASAAVSSLQTQDRTRAIREHDQSKPTLQPIQSLDAGAKSILGTPAGAETESGVGSSLQVQQVERPVEVRDTNLETHRPTPAPHPLQDICPLPALVVSPAGDWTDSTTKTLDDSDLIRRLLCGHQTHANEEQGLPTSTELKDDVQRQETAMASTTEELGAEPTTKALHGSRVDEQRRSNSDEPKGGVERQMNATLHATEIEATRYDSPGDTLQESTTTSVTGAATSDMTSSASANDAKGGWGDSTPMATLQPQAEARAIRDQDQSKSTLPAPPLLDAESRSNSATPFAEAQATENGSRLDIQRLQRPEATVEKLQKEVQELRGQVASAQRLEATVEKLQKEVQELRGQIQQQSALEARPGKSEQKKEGFVDDHDVSAAPFKPDPAWIELFETRYESKSAEVKASQTKDHGAPSAEDYLKHVGVLPVFRGEEKCRAVDGIRRNLLRHNTPVARQVEFQEQLQEFNLRPTGRAQPSRVFFLYDPKQWQRKSDSMA